MIDVNDFLEHHGVKGMRWGIRRDPKTGIRPSAQALQDSWFGRAAKKNVDRHLARKDKKWQKNIYKKNNTYKGHLAIHNGIVDRINGKALEDFNNNPKYRNVTDKSRTITNKDLDIYYKDFSKFVEKHADQFVREHYGVSPSGNFKAVLDRSNKQAWVVKIVPKKIRHSNDMPPIDILIIEANHDDNGLITSMRKIQTSAMHSEELGETFLEHHGVKGMRWGVRRKRTFTQSGDSKKVSTLRKKPVHSLTNKQLKAANERLNLEQNFRRMNPSKVKKGHDQVKTVLSIAGTATSIVALANSPTGRAAISAGKKFIKKKTK